MIHAFEEAITHIEAAIDYVFRDKSLLMQAFTRTSFCNEQSAQDPIRRQSSEVLEFFGDSVLSAAIVSLLIREQSERYPYGIRTDLGEGHFSNIKSRLSDKTNLSRSMRALGLQRYLLMGKGDVKLGIEQELSVMEDLFESIIGAVYIDCGMHMEPVMQVVGRMLDVSEYLQHSPDTVPQSAKNTLQEFCADKSRRLPPPVYEDVREEGPEHMRIYTRACRIGDRIWGIGEGKNRKAADTAAAHDALTKLQQAQTQGALTTNAADTDTLRILNDTAARRRLGVPAYTDLGRNDDATADMMPFAFECRLKGKTTRGTGASKREAKRMAAGAMLRLLKK